MRVKIAIYNRCALARFLMSVVSCMSVQCVYVCMYVYIMYISLCRYRESCRPPPHLLTPYPAAVFDLQPHVLTESKRDASALLRGHGVCWIHPQGQAAVEVCGLCVCLSVCLFD